MIGADSDLERLLALAQGGDSTATGRLLEKYRNYLTLLARHQIGRRLQSKVDSSDLVQEAFLEAHRDFGRFRGNTSAELAGWLRRILATNIANLVDRYCGTHRRNVRLELDLAEEMERSSQALDRGLMAKQSSPSSLAARRDQAVILADALEQLPEDYRQILILRHLEERSFPEIARQMERSIDSVKNVWARALARLRQTVGGLP